MLNNSNEEIQTIFLSILDNEDLLFYLEETLETTTVNPVNDFMHYVEETSGISGKDLLFIDRVILENYVFEYVDIHKKNLIN